MVKLLFNSGILFAIIVSIDWLILMNLYKDDANSFTSHVSLYEISINFIAGWKAKLYIILDIPLLVLFPAKYNFSKDFAFMIPSASSLHKLSSNLQYDKSKTFNFL